MERLVLEVLVDSLDAARAAQAGGADRLELCQNLFEGGTTPSAGMISAVVAAVRLPVNVMLRPRGADFCYSDDEMEVMQRDLRLIKQSGANGVVFGILHPDGSIDAERCSVLTAAARPLSVTFHRAFDVTRDAVEALEDLIRLGIDRVLTSGQEATAFEGAELISQLVQRAAGRIAVMAGGGIREHNARRILQLSGAREIHVSASGAINSRMEYRHVRVPMGRELRAPEFSWNSTNATRVGAYRRLLDECTGVG